MTQNIFLDIGVIILIATTFAFIGRYFKQPLIPFYILAGIIIGPILGLIKNSEIIFTLSELGIAFLLFNVGLEMNLNKLKNVEHVTIFGGLAQIITLFSTGFIIAIALGFFKLEAVYIGLIIAFSSTMVVLKLLSDKREIDTLHGRIIIGILVMQDIIAVLVLSFLSTSDGFGAYSIFFSVIKGLLVFAIALLFGTFIFPWIYKFAAKSKELLFLCSIAILFGFSILFNFLGFSIAIGAFVAGLSLAPLNYNIEIISITKPLRDFFATIFFVSLGIGLALNIIDNMLLPIIIFAVLILFIKPIIIMLICSFYGYKRRTSFIVANSLGQASEFSLILVASGLLFGHINENLFTMVVILAAITITLTSYFVKFEDYFFKKLCKSIKIFDIFSEKENELVYMTDKLKNHIILIGYDRIGYSIVNLLSNLKDRLLVVDFNPEIIKKLIKKKVNCIYGDASQEEIISRIGINKAKIIISTSSSYHDNLYILRKAREENRNAIVIVTASQISEAMNLYKNKANYVILPHFLGGEHVASLLKDKINKKTILKDIKKFHIRELIERQQLGKVHRDHR